MANEFSVEFEGYNELLKALTKIASDVKDMPVIKAGVPDTGSYPDGTSIEMVGTVHEFGSEEQNIPERSYLRSTVLEQTDKYVDLMAGGLDLVIQEGKDPYQLLTNIGLVLESDIKEKITTLSEPALAPSTIARRTGNSSNPLVDTGLLRRSIISEVDKGE